VDDRPFGLALEHDDRAVTTDLGARVLYHRQVAALFRHRADVHSRRDRVRDGEQADDERDGNGNGSRHTRRHPPQQRGHEAEREQQEQGQGRDEVSAHHPHLVGKRPGSP